MTRLCGLLVSLSLGVGVAHAQTHVTAAMLTGAVVDQTGGVLPGASVEATRLSTNVARVATTDEEGRYQLALLEPGTYRVVVALDGFTTQVVEPLVLRLGQAAALETTLTLARLEQQVTVVAEAQLVDPRQTEVSSVITDEQIDGLPINRRDYIGLALITPGASEDLIPTQGVSFSSGLSFVGQRARSNNIMVDGVDNNGAATGSVRGLFSQEAIREFRVLTNSYSAEYGKASGGVVNIITKSGSNDFRGNTFFFLRDASLNSKGYFEQFDAAGRPVAQDKAPFARRQWGGTLGGPLRQNRTFFFTSFERIAAETANFVTIAPAAAMVLGANGFPVQVGHVPYDDHVNHFLGKINHQWTASSSFVVRLNYSDLLNENVVPYGGLIDRSGGTAQDRAEWSLVASETDLLSERWISELRVQAAGTDEKNRDLDPRGGPRIEIAGVATVGRSSITPFDVSETRFQVTETVTHVGPRHLFKAGVDFSYLRNQTRLESSFGGLFLFFPLPAIPALGLP